MSTAVENIPALLLTREEAAVATKVCCRTLDAVIRRGDIRVVREGRRVLISIAALNEWIARREGGAV